MERNEGRSKPRRLLNEIKDRLRGPVSERLDKYEDMHASNPEDVAVYGMDLQPFPMPHRQPERISSTDEKTYSDSDPIIPRAEDVTLEEDAPVNVIYSPVASRLAMNLVEENLRNGGTLTFPSIGVTLTSADLRNPIIEADGRVVDSVSPAPDTTE